MEETFEAIGLDVPSEKDFNYLAERAGDQGEATQLLRRGAVLHGRCWKLGEGLEVWTVLYESGTGDIFYADCRPGFRARYTQRISPWALTEYDEEGEAIVHGYPIKAPMLDIHTVGAGGGSIAYVDSGGLLKVGPRSAGAAPGPVCYDKGNTEPTVTVKGSRHSLHWYRPGRCDLPCISLMRSGSALPQWGQIGPFGQIIASKRATAAASLWKWDWVRMLMA